MTAINRYNEDGAPQGALTGRFGYTGQPWFGEMGLYYYRARVYNPAIARFMQADPIGYGGGMNLYAYVGGDGVNATDPSGLAPKRLPGVTCTGTRIANGCAAGGLGSSLSGFSSAAVGGQIPTGEGLLNELGYNTTGMSNAQIRAYGESIYLRAELLSVALQPYATNGTPHAYSFFSPTCSASECTIDQAFESWRRNSAPGAPYAEAGRHTRRLLLGNYISQFVDVGNRTIINRTLPGHRYYDGEVIIQVINRNGFHGAQITGKGTGSNALENSILGPWMFHILGRNAAAPWQRINDYLVN